MLQNIVYLPKKFSENRAFGITVMESPADFSTRTAVQ